MPIALSVDRIVEVVGTARREAKADKGDHGAQRRPGMGQDTGGSGRRDDQHVLQPLLRARQPNQCGHPMPGFEELLACSFGAQAEPVYELRARLELERFVLEPGHEAFHRSHGYARSQPDREADDHRQGGAHRADAEAEL
jgi:hypothetical protein